MAQEYKYFVIPSVKVPDDPACTVWYPNGSTRPPADPRGRGQQMLVGYTRADRLPEGAILLGSSIKDPPVPPPPPPPGTEGELASYAAEFEAWLGDGRGLSPPGE